MHAIVCIKSVPDTTEVRFNPETGTLMRGEVGLTLNPFDAYAIEEAIRLKEAHGGTVTVLTMGPPPAEKELREAIAMGCDQAILLSDVEFAGADTWATSYTLAQAISKLGEYDIILCGRQAADGDTGQVGPGIANQLEIPQLTYVFKIREIDFEQGYAETERLMEEGREIARTRLPALLSVVKDINQPRYPTFRGIRRARGLEIPIWGAKDLDGADPTRLGLDGSPTAVVRVFSPPQREGKVELIEGANVTEIAEKLADKILRDKVI
ncbi:MAG: electron transfer flavoprotein subunit beta [Chloroflexi bacterium RBG_13_56_8]|nr:MAG: electron transfer flavoprotein subunit beta [Chloroflexi bacterium RBG_13_56_8]